VEPLGIHDAESKADYVDVNPIGRVPALVLDNGEVLPESEVICEYLEDAYPDPPLLPKDAWGRAQVRLMSRISDIYIVMAMAERFNVVVDPPEKWDQKLIQKCLAETDKALEYLDEFIGDQGYAVGSTLSHADGTLAPILLLVDEWLPIFRGEPLLPKHQRVAKYWKNIQQDPICARVIEETRTAVHTAMGG
jgi:glutathione S-transferase